MDLRATLCLAAVACAPDAPDTPVDTEAAADTEVAADTDPPGDTDTTPIPPGRGEAARVEIDVRFEPDVVVVTGRAILTDQPSSSGSASSSCRLDASVVSGIGGGSPAPTVDGGTLAVTLGGTVHVIEPDDDLEWVALLDPIAETQDPLPVDVSTSGGVAPPFHALAHRPTEVVLDARLDGTAISRDTDLVVTFPGGTGSTLEVKLVQWTFHGDYPVVTTVTCTGRVADGRVVVPSRLLRQAIEPNDCASTPGGCLQVHYRVSDTVTADLDDRGSGTLTTWGTVSGPGGTLLEPELASVR